MDRCGECFYYMSHTCTAPVDQHKEFIAKRPSGTDLAAMIKDVDRYTDITLGRLRSDSIACHLFVER